MIKKRRKIEAQGESKSQPVLSCNALDISQSQEGDQVMQEVNKEGPGNAFKMEDDFADYTEAE